MAIPKIKATYSLDPETIRLLERVSQRWGVSKSEALRRAIHASAATAVEGNRRVAALDRLQQASDLSTAAAAGWARHVRAERRTGRTGSRGR